MGFDVNRLRDFSRAFWLLWAVAVIGWAGRISLPFLTLYMTKQAGFSTGEAGVVLGVFGIGGVISVLLSGTLIDKLGAKPVLLITLLGTAVFCFLLAGANSPVTIGVSVLLLGLFSQAMTPSYSTTISDIVRPDQLRTAFSMMAIGQNVGFMVLPVVAGILGSISFRLVYLMEGSLCLIAALIVQFGVKKSISSRGHASLSFWKSLSGLKVVLRDRYFVVFVVQNIVFMMIYMQSQTTLPLVMEGQGFPPEQYGLLLSINGLLVVVMQLPADSVVGRLRRRLMLPFSSGLLAVGVLLQVGAVTFWLYVVCLVIWTAAELINMPVVYAESVRLAAEGYTGRYVALFSLSLSFSTIIGGALGGLILEHLGRSALWAAMGGLAILLGLWRFASFNKTR